MIIKRKKRTIKDQKNSGINDPLQGKERKLEGVKAKIITALGQSADLEDR